MIPMASCNDIPGVCGLGTVVSGSDALNAGVAHDVGVMVKVLDWKSRFIVKLKLPISAPQILALIAAHAGPATHTRIDKA